MSDKRPVLFVDVDGVISLFGFNPSETPPGTFHSIDGILHCIGYDAAARLSRLAERYELVWATGWEEKANEYLVHILGMEGDLPVLTFDGRAVFGSSHWKLEAIDEYSSGRPAAWLDDNLDERAEAWAARREEPTLLVVTESALGITEEHVDELLRWADEVSEGPDRVLPGDQTRGQDMGDGALDDAKGRLKEAGGDLTDDDSLKAEGKVDRATGSVKDKVGDASDKIKDAIPGKD
ncbi:MAG: hypothetical protein QOF55_568 [Thermoleophilaceae bacterium]|nr:hypothetical protein [Thermoleophilaceae bacterium]